MEIKNDLYDKERLEASLSRTEKGLTVEVISPRPFRSRWITPNPRVLFTQDLPRQPRVAEPMQALLSSPQPMRSDSAQST